MAAHVRPFIKSEKHADDNDNDNDNNNNKMVMGMNQKAKKSYLKKGPTEEQLERRKFIKGRLFEDDDDEDIDFTIPTERGGKPDAGKILSLQRNTKPKSRRSIGLYKTHSCQDLRGEPNAGKSLSPKRNTKPIGLSNTQSCHSRMTDMEPGEKVTPMKHAERRVREQKALGKSKSDASVLFATGTSIQEQDSSGPGLLSRGLKILENLYEDCA
jgi:hypothetical protein